METGFWEGIGYLLLLPVILVAYAFVADIWWTPYWMSLFKQKWGYRGLTYALLITLLATVLWWGVILWP
ncbi:hypothetical protein KKC97_01860 [bacterium]|nr:hypothetical protein [bacterium]